MANVNEFNEQEFNSNVKNGNDTYLVDFWAPWCGPCITMAPVLNEYATKQEKVKVAKVNVDENPNVAQEYGISGIPTMIVFKSGKEVDRITGMVPLNVLEEKLSSHS
jgi:thioredoxin 1